MTAEQRKIGNYVLARLLGEGGMGSVYLGEHPQIGRRVAIKLLSPQMSAQPGFAERFIAEARAVTRISHPNVIDIFDFGETDDGQLYYVMELLEGRELGAVIEHRAPLTVDEIWPYVEQICAALAAAHAAGVVHRDLKPENIFVLDRSPFALKILDFGIAKLLEPESGQASGSRTATGMVMGTPLTIAPEQAAGQPQEIGPHTDLYSLGVILFWMLAGSPPFEDERSAVLLAKHITEPPPSVAALAPETPQPIVELVAACLAKEPEGRPASAERVAEIFQGGLGDRWDDVTGPVAPPLVGVAPTVPPSAEGAKQQTTFRSAAAEVAADEPRLPRSPLATWGAVGLGVVAVAAVALVVARGGDEPRGTVERRTQEKERRVTTPGAGQPAVSATTGAASGDAGAADAARPDADGVRAAGAAAGSRRAAQARRRRRRRRERPPAKKPRAKKPRAKKPPAKKPLAKKPPAKKPPAKKPPPPKTGLGEGTVDKF